MRLECQFIDGGAGLECSPPATTATVATTPPVATPTPSKLTQEVLIVLIMLASVWIIHLIRMIRGNR